MFQHYSRKGEMDAWVTCKEPLIHVSFERVLVMLHLFLCIMGKLFNQVNFSYFPMKSISFSSLQKNIFLFFFLVTLHAYPSNRTNVFPPCIEWGLQNKMEQGIKFHHNMIYLLMQGQTVHCFSRSEHFDYQTVSAEYCDHNGYFS